MIDWDGDGVMDGIAVDTDGDGIADAVGHDLDGDGEPDVIGIDIDGDGVIDGIDSDGDGQLDAIGIDIDGDGLTDGLGLDADGDGEPDGIDTDGDGEPDAFPIDLDGDGEPDAIGSDTDGDGDIDVFDPNSSNTENISTGGGGGGEQPEDSDPGPWASLDGSGLVEELYNELIKANKEDVAYWLAWQGNIKLRKYDPSDTYAFRSPPNPKVRRENGNLILSFDQNKTVAQWATGLIAHVESGDSTEYNRYYYEFMVNEPDINNPNLAVGDSIRPDNKAWVREVLQRGPGIMAGGAFWLALDVLPLGGAGKVLMNLANGGFRLIRHGGNSVIATVGTRTTEVLAETRLGQIVSRVTGRVGADEAAEWVGRFCFSPDTLVQTEHGPRPIGGVRGGDRVWSFRFGVGDWVLCRVAEQSTSTYQGTLTRLRTSGGTIESTGDHPAWVVRGAGLADRPRCPSLIPTEDEGRRLDGRWVSARNVRAGDVVYGRDGLQHLVLEAESREALSEVCTLAIDQHANFAVGADGVLVHNGTCWKDIITEATGRAVPAALTRSPALAALVHGHHIVMKTIPNDVREPFIRGAQNILNRYQRFGVSVLAQKTDVTAFVQAERAAGRPVELHNLCYATNSRLEIHSTEYCKAVFDKLAVAERLGNTVAQKAANIKAELASMARIMEQGGKFW